MPDNYISKSDKIYTYHPISYEYMGEGIANLDPLETKIHGVDLYAKPSNSTFLKPPKIKKNEVLIFENGKWVKHTDFRGSVYYLKDTTKITITEIDVEIPPNSILNPPDPSLVKPIYNDGEWVESAIFYKEIPVETKNDVDMITHNLINELGEDKAKTEKMIAGDEPCEVWDTFIENREILLQEGREFITLHNLV